MTDLVSINPSEIDLSSLPWLPLNAKTGFPKNPAIYFAIDSQGTVQYVGRSINPKSRWGNHHKYEALEAIGGIKIVYLFVDSPELLPQIESALISWFKPALNTAGRPSFRGLEGDDLELRDLREKVNLTILEVSRELDCAESTIRNWEKGRSVPKLEVWQAFRLRDLYQCSEADLTKAVEKTLAKARVTKTQ